MTEPRNKRGSLKTGISIGS